MNTTLKTTSKATAAILGMALIAGLSACASSAATSAGLHSGTAVATVTSTPAASPVASSTPAPVATTAAPVAVNNGAVLTADQAKALPDGVTAYKMTDGTLIAVAHTDPVPANVVADITAKANAQWPNGPVTSYADTSAQQKVLNDWIADVSRSTGGRTVLVVVEYMKLYPPAPGAVQTLTYPWQVIQNNVRNLTKFKSYDAALAGAQATAASTGPAIVVTLGK